MQLCVQELDFNQSRLRKIENFEPLVNLRVWRRGRSAR